MIGQGVTRVAVVGAGIGGLALAGLLSRASARHVEVTVYEQASALTDVGAGIVISPNARRVLDALGLAEALLQDAVDLEAGFERRRWEDGRVLSVQPFDREARRRYGGGMSTVHRADLLALLRSAVSGAVVTGRRCVAVDDPGDGVRPARLRFRDGTVTDADVVVGADGVHSVVRDTLARPGEATFAGMSAFRALIPTADAPDLARRPVHTIWLGPGRHLVHYPVRSGSMVNLAGVVETSQWIEESWTAECTPADLAAEFVGWDPRVRHMIDAVTATGRWALFDRPSLERWSRGRITLLGDAAHPMRPFLAQGAAQALEDAAVLASCLAASPLDAVTALSGYERRRRPRAVDVARASLDQSDVINLPDGPAQRARDAAYADQDVIGALAWLHAHDPFAGAEPEG